MKVVVVPESKKHEFIKNVKPNFIKNRFDIIYGDDFFLYRVDDVNGIFYIPVHIDKDEVKVGVWLTNISKKGFSCFKRKVFKDNKNVKIISAECSINKVRNKSKKKIHWHVDLSKTLEEFNKLLSKKARYNTKWYPKKIVEDFGGYEIKQYAVNEIKVGIVEEYFKLKEATHRKDYNADPKEYLAEYNVTNAYVMYINGSIVAIAFANITDDNVYLENITYNQEYSKYSVGMVLYYYIISELLNKGYKTLFLSTGTSEYKHRFNGNSTECYNGRVMRFSTYVAHLIKKIF